MYVTFVTCWYTLHSKFPVDTYVCWMKNMLSEVNHYQLVLFTDNAGEILLRERIAPDYLQHPRIKIVQKPVEAWHNYQYQAAWIKNHAINSSLNNKTEWKLNMLWAEKIHFVNDARINHYFPPTDFYGWCDIGYFREGPCPTFCDKSKILSLNKNKIYYACVDPMQFSALRQQLTARNEHGLPVRPIPPEQISIAGGFFISHHSKIDAWRLLFDAKLRRYFQHEYLVKDDQMIILDCVVSEPHRFELLTEEPAYNLNAWFQFRRYLGGAARPLRQPSPPL